MKCCFAVILCLLVMISCKKDIARDASGELNGKWELRITDGGFSYQHNIYPAGNGNMIAFSGTNQYTRTDVIDGETTKTSGTYGITHGITCYSSDETFIKFADTDTDAGLILSVSGDSLYIKANTCVIADAVDRTYVKIKSEL